jgi:hypothetical protein
MQTKNVSFQEGDKVFYINYGAVDKHIRALKADPEIAGGRLKDFFRVGVVKGIDRGLVAIKNDESARVERVAVQDVCPFTGRKHAPKAALRSLLGEVISARGSVSNGVIYHGERILVRAFPSFVWDFPIVKLPEIGKKSIRRAG